MEQTDLTTSQKLPLRLRQSDDVSSHHPGRPTALGRAYKHAQKMMHCITQAQRARRLQKPNRAPNPNKSTSVETPALVISSDIGTTSGGGSSAWSCCTQNMKQVSTKFPLVVGKRHLGGGKFEVPSQQEIWESSGHSKTNTFMQRH